MSASEILLPTEQPEAFEVTLMAPSSFPYHSASSVANHFSVAAAFSASGRDLTFCSHRGAR